MTKGYVIKEVDGNEDNFKLVCAVIKYYSCPYYTKKISKDEYLIVYYANIINAIRIPMKISWLKFMEYHEERQLKRIKRRERKINRRLVEI